MSALLEIRGLVKEFPERRGRVLRRVLDGVDLDVERGCCVALVGESGSGKTTLARCAVQLLAPSAGSVRFDGEDLAALAPAALRQRRRRFQMVFQDPQSAFDPRFTLARSVEEPLAVHTDLPRRARRQAALDLLAQVGLGAELADRYPHEISGGQRQRVGIARALATGPDLLVADEPTSALDVSVRAQILNLLAALRASRGLALLVIAHDLAAVAHLADRVAVLHDGRIVEESAAAELFRRPRHPYTAALLAAVPAISAIAPAGERNPGGMR